MLENANTLFERKAKQNVMKEAIQSPFLRKSFKDDEKGIDRFNNYHD